MLEQRKNLLNTMVQKELRATGKKTSYAERAKEAEVHIECFREMLLGAR